MARIAKMILILRDYEDHRPKRGSCGVDEMADQIEMLTVRIEKRDATIAAAVCRRIKWQGAKCAMIPMGEISILIRSSSSMRLERDRGIRRSASRISSWQAVIDRVRQAGHMTAPSDGNFRNKCTH